MVGKEGASKARLGLIDTKTMDHDYSTHKAFVASCRHIVRQSRAAGKSTQMGASNVELRFVWPDNARVDIDFRLAQRRRGGTLYGIWCKWMLRGVLPFYERLASSSWDYSVPFIRALRSWVDTGGGLRTLSSCAWEWMKGAESASLQTDSRMHLAHAALTLTSSLSGAGPVKVGFDGREGSPIEDYRFFRIWPYYSHMRSHRFLAPGALQDAPTLRLEAGVFPDVYSLLQWASALEADRNSPGETRPELDLELDLDLDLDLARLQARVEVMQAELKEQLYGLKAVNDLAEIIRTEEEAVMRTPEGLGEPWIALQVWESTFPEGHAYTPLVHEWAHRLIREDDERVAERHKKCEEKWRPTRSGRSFL